MASVRASETAQPSVVATETAHDLFIKQPRRLATLDDLFKEKESRALALANLRCRCCLVSPGTRTVRCTFIGTDGGGGGLVAAER